MELGIIGLAKSGKTTLFNALSRGHAQTAAFGRSVEPNVAVVKVPDNRLDKLAVQHKSAKIVYAEVHYLDMGGTPERFGKGEGFTGPLLNALGREDALIHVVRAFADPSLPHPLGSVDAERDIETINLELAYADAALIERRIERLHEGMKSANATEREARQAEAKWLLEMKQALEAGTPVRAMSLTEEQKRALVNVSLLTAMPLLVLVNIGEDQIPEQAALEARLRARFDGPGLTVLAAGGQLEMELAQMEPDEAAEMREAMDLPDGALDRVIEESYRLLGLISFITTGPDETRAWTITLGTNAQRAAGKIHTDLEKGFIRSETIGWEQLLETGGWNEAKKRGLLRTEGKTYIMQDGDVVNILFSK